MPSTPSAQEISGSLIQRVLSISWNPAWWLLNTASTAIGERPGADGEQQRDEPGLLGPAARDQRR